MAFHEAPKVTIQNRGGFRSSFSMPEMIDAGRGAPNLVPPEVIFTAKTAAAYPGTPSGSPPPPSFTPEELRRNS